MRLRYDPNAHVKLKNFGPRYLECDDKIGQKLKDYLANYENLVIEIGMGKGQFLAKMALLSPKTLFLGVEQAPAVLACAIKNPLVQQTPNLIVCAVNAILLPSMLNEIKSKAIYLNFSDP
ncbi:unnamed protein product [Didymodactylos carnosus]|uniref:tRNA (guanine(46)-N(7))-methyltransferase n=1 Tax=Didymodactylos carnosus TaxID=1234261 RepID=A0A8S2DS74_9BILA|nr:unnamed protein product [Didymodactylos carnosus]CAF3766926.1 unnamed protein product [Didymodactylos carnosus]